MRVALGLVFFLCIGEFSRVLAADPPPPPPSPPAAQAEQAPTPASPSTPAPTSTSAQPRVVAEAVSADGVTKEELKRVQVAGYKQKTRGDQIVYCRMDPVLGTRFDREMCATARDLEFIRAHGQEMATQAQKGNFGFPKGAQ
jgi:hypothetical protein